MSVSTVLFLIAAIVATIEAVRTQSLAAAAVAFLAAGHIGW